MPVEEPEVNAPAEEAKETEEIAVLEDLPVLTVRDTVIFPGALLPITVGRPSSVALVQSLGENRTLAVVSQLDPRVDTPRARGSLPDRHRVRDAQGHPRAQGQPAAVLRRHRAHPHPRVHRHRTVPEGPRRADPRHRAGNHARNRSAAAERGEPVPADRGGVAQSLRRPLGHRRQHHRTRPPGRFRRRQPALPRAPPSASSCWSSRRPGAAQRNPPPPDARAGTAGTARPHPVAGAGAAFAEPARVLPARAVEGHPEGTGRRRRRQPRYRGSARRNWKPPACPKRSRPRPCAS